MPPQPAAELGAHPPSADPPSAVLTDADPGSADLANADLANAETALSIDPALGGSLSMPDGSAALAVPPGATDAPVLFALDPVSPAAPDAGLGTTMFEVSAQDATGAAVASFAAPLMVTVAPSPTDLQAVGGDPGHLTLASVDPASGAWVALPTTLNADGTLSAEVTAPGLVSTLQADAPALADTSAQDD